jgi:hypothetical protein
VHAIEHIDNEELLMFIETLPKSIKYIYLESPLKNTINNWTGRNNAHVLESGWNDIILAFKSKGYNLVYGKDDVRCLQITPLSI